MQASSTQIVGRQVPICTLSAALWEAELAKPCFSTAAPLWLLQQSTERERGREGERDRRGRAWLAHPQLLHLSAVGVSGSHLQQGRVEGLVRAQDGCHLHHHHRQLQEGVIAQVQHWCKQRRLACTCSSNMEWYWAGRQQH